VVSHTRVAIAAACVLMLAACSGTDAPSDERRTPQSSPSGTEAAPQAGLRLTTPRAVHRATRLADGSVILTGGCTEPGCGGADEARVADIYDPGTERFTPGSPMLSPRVSGSATLLEDGRLLLVGGYPGEGQAPSAQAELFDPATGTFTSVGSLAVPRADHTATLLQDGTVIVAGGFDGQGAALASTELFDPMDMKFSPGPQLSWPRAAQVAVAVGRRVVLIGGTADTHGLADTDVLQDGRWSPGPRLRTPRVKMGAAWAGAERVLVVGGSTGIEGRTRLSSTELVDLASGRVSVGPELATGEYKLDGAVVRLRDGRVAIAGGPAVELYDPRTNRLTLVPEPGLAVTSFGTATPVADDELLVVGGYDESIVPSSRALLVHLPPRRVV
jgi:hypothetical protein